MQLRPRLPSAALVSSLRRAHSTSSSPLLPAFAPTGSTSADTEIPYGDPQLASSAYLPPRTPPSSSTPDRAATESPQFTPRQRQVIESIIRVDQAGELGANYIYSGQHAVLKRRPDKRIADLVQEMWDGEKKHIAAFDKLVTQHNVRPTALYPIWKVAGFALGAGTALLGKRAAMACTEAVETAIGEHYNSQLKALSDESIFPQADLHPSVVLLKQCLTEFRDDELWHLSTAVANESQLVPAHALLSAAIGLGCKLAIATTERI